MIDKNMPLNCMVFLLSFELTLHANLRSQILDSTKWPTVLVHNILEGHRSCHSDISEDRNKRFSPGFAGN